jgi:hypothetical protein
VPPFFDKSIFSRLLRDEPLMTFPFKEWNFCVDAYESSQAAFNERNVMRKFERHFRSPLQDLSRVATFQFLTVFVCFNQ